MNFEKIASAISRLFHEAHSASKKSGSMSIFALLSIVAAFVIPTVVNVLVFRGAMRRFQRPLGYPRPRKWIIAPIILAALGVAVGFWFQFYFSYPIGDECIIYGVPMPWAIDHWENGQWVDYIGLVGLTIPLNIYFFETAFLLPMPVAFLVHSLRSKKKKKTGPSNPQFT